MPNPALAQAAQDVPADSSTVFNDQQPDGTPGPDTGDQSGDSASSAGGRTVDQVHKEFDRKFRELRDEFRAQFADLKGTLGAASGSSPQQAASVPTDLNSMSSAQLEALRPHIPQDKLPAFEELVRVRREDERVDARFDARIAQRDIASRRRAANEEAYSAFPELHNESGKLYRMVNRVLDEYGDEVTTKNPFAVRDAAYEAARRLGITPKSGMSHSSRTSDSGHRSGSRTAPADGGEDEESFLSVEESERIARNLANALPGGKGFTPEMLARIRANAGLYGKNRDLFIRK